MIKKKIYVFFYFLAFYTKFEYCDPILVKFKYMIAF